MSYDNWKTTNPDDEFLGPPPDETRFIECVCGGEGRRIVCQRINGALEDVDLGQCSACEGAGVIPVETLPIELEDMDE